MKNLTNMSENKLNIVGKLLDVNAADGKLEDGRHYERATFTVRVNQTYNNKQEISEIPVSIFATQYTRDNRPNPAYENLQRLKSMKTVQGYGEAEADVVRLSGASISENNFVAKSGNLINGWQIRSSFINSGNKAQDIASFNIDIFIMDMHPEIDNDGEETGRLIVKGAIVQYNNVVDVLEFVVEGADRVEYIERNWNINDTVNIGGRIRVTSQETTRPASTSSWGEELPETTTRMVRELVITRGSDEPFEEDFAYDPAEIKKGFNARKAKIEQMQMDAKNRSTQKAAPVQTTSSKYSWE